METKTNKTQHDLRMDLLMVATDLACLAEQDSITSAQVEQLSLALYDLHEEWVRSV